MPLRKRLQKFGNGLAILLSREMLDQLGLREGDSVVLEVVSDVLIVRRDGVEPLTGTQLLSSLYATEATVFPDGGPEGEGKQRVALALRAWGPLTARELAERVGIRADYASKVLAQAARDGWVVKRDGRYELT